jgi:capsular exopolysaccharide synthesis family protein
MSRIDEALARARSSRPEALAPATPDSHTPLDTDFPAEPTESLSTTLARGPATERPSLTERQLPTAAPAVPVEGGAAIVEAVGDLTRLPSAEKLMLNGGESIPIEQYRRLAARLLMAQAERGARVVMVTSAFPGEGKTLTATNLALTLSESYKRKVLLIDADLRRPWVHQIFQVPNVSGLNDGLRDGGDRKIPLLNFTENLSILTAGRPEPDPMSVLSGDRMRRVLEEAGDRFEWVIIDTPPVALLTDAHLLSSLVHAVVLVVQSGKTPLPAIKTAIEAVGRERILGVVLNRVAGDTAQSAYSYYGSYRAEQAQPRSV